MKNVYIFRIFKGEEVVGVFLQYCTEDEAKERANALCTERESINYLIANDIEIQAGRMAGAIA